MSSATAEAFKAWLAPSTFGKTLITTRSREYEAVGTTLRLEVLTPQEAIELLCALDATVRTQEDGHLRLRNSALRDAEHDIH